MRTNAISSLFQPLTLRSMTLENRIVLPPMTTMLANADGTIGERFIAFYAARARGGAGLITSETVEVHPYTHNLAIGDRGFSSIYDDRFLPGLERFARRMHEEGAKCSVQLHHSGHAMVQIDPAKPPLAPSAIACPGGAVPRALTRDEIHEIVAAYGAAARRARQAGFDAVDLHGGHGYLIAQFLSPVFNRRTDEYGGDLSGRLRFAREVIQEVRRNVGPDFPIIFRLSADERVPDGRTVPESVVIAPHLVEAGADCLSITTGMQFDITYTVAGFGIPKGLNVEAAARVKQAVDVPVLVAGKLGDPLVAAAAIAQEHVDLVAIGRGLVADADWPAKVREGRFDEIRPCIACNLGCIGGLLAGRPFQCLVNADAGREWEASTPAPARRKRVFVAGGGPAGLEACRAAAERGHEVTLYERDGELGGQLRLAAIPPRKQEIAPFVRYLAHEVARLGVEVQRGQALTVDEVKRQQPDAVVVATGSAPARPAIPGIDLAHVVLAHDVLAGRAPTGMRVLIAGAGEVGCETAEHLRGYGKQVILVEARPAIAPDEIMVPRRWRMANLERSGIEMRPSTKVIEILPQAVVVEGPRGRESLDGIDTVVIALGVAPDTNLARALEGMPIELHVIGDAHAPGSALAAVAKGAEVGRLL